MLDDLFRYEFTSTSVYLYRKMKEGKVYNGIYTSYISCNKLLYINAFYEYLDEQLW